MKECPAFSDAAIVISRSGNWSSNMLTRLRIFSQTQPYGSEPAITIATSVNGNAALAMVMSMKVPKRAATSIQKNSTVFNGTSARSSIVLILRHGFRWPNAFSVARKTPPSIASRRCFRAFFEVTFVSPTCTEIRLRTQEPRRPASRNKQPSSMRKPTATATPSGPPGPYAPFGTIFDGPESFASTPGTDNPPVAEPWP